MNSFSNELLLLLALSSSIVGGRGAVAGLFLGVSRLIAVVVFGTTIVASFDANAVAVVRD